MKKLLSLLFVLLFVCLLGCDENDNDKLDLPRAAEDTSIVGTYTFSHAFLRPGDEVLQLSSTGVSEVDALRVEKALQTKLKNLESEWHNKAFRFDADGVFIYQQRYTEEFYNSGCFIYDGKQLDLYTFTGEPYAPPLHVPVLEAEFDKDILTVYFDESYGLTFTRAQDSPAS